MGAAVTAPVELVDLRRTYGERVALDGVSLELRPGELFGLLGPNGGGKTTLFRVLSTVLPPSSGSVRVMGHALPAEGAAVRRAIGVVFQSPSVDKYLTVRENLVHQGRLYGLRGDDLRARIAEAWTGSPADSGAAWNWRRGCSTDRGCCSSTSRARASTPPRGATSGTTWHCSATAAT